MVPGPTRNWQVEGCCMISARAKPNIWQKPSLHKELLWGKAHPVQNHYPERQVEALNVTASLSSNTRHVHSPARDKHSDPRGSNEPVSLDPLPGTSPRLQRAPLASQLTSRGGKIMSFKVSVFASFPAALGGKVFQSQTAGGFYLPGMPRAQVADGSGGGVKVEARGQRHLPNILLHTSDLSASLSAPLLVKWAPGGVLSRRGATRG
ncbi:hypothetical protein EYF80_053169 [Liparis tanakae]|uniref:Uncharacterized protein n=1 Tax=Liparis tanakae TaxID=230148 RepID=A0A4Z2F8P6_9TELE|nr:hypothetical protein EYF80_053169 [Liparis tanakae]